MNSFFKPEHTNGHKFRFTTETKRTCYQTSEEQQLDFHPFTSAVISTTDTRSKHNLWGHMSTMLQAFKQIQTVGTTSQPSRGVFFQLWRCLVPASKISSPLSRLGPRPSRLVIPLARLCPKRCCHLGSIRKAQPFSPTQKHRTPLRPNKLIIIHIYIYI